MKHSRSLCFSARCVIAVAHHHLAQNNYSFDALQAYCVEHMRACCWYSRRHPDRTHGGVLNVHTGGFPRAKLHHTPHTTPHVHTQPTQHTTPHVHTTPQHHMYTHHTPHTQAQTGWRPFFTRVANFMAEFSCRPRQVDGDGAAKRRRLRRLRSWWRHEQQTVAAVLATVSHHSYPKVDTAHDGLRAQRTVTSTREGVEHVTHGGLRAQKPPLPWKRPGVLLDPEPVQVVDAVTSYVAAPGPSSLVPRLAANDALDNATLKFLVARALLDRREQEEERRKRRR